jgi:uncharacterized membrane protein
MIIARLSQMSRLRLLMIVLAFVGLGVATYLTVVHYVGFQLLACAGGHGGRSSCETVQSSQWSKLAGIPVALLGLVGYVGILGSLLVRDREESRMATLGLTLIGFGFSAYLTYREGHSIHAWCEWCLSSAAIMTVLFALAIARFLTAPAGGSGGGRGGDGDDGPDDDDDGSGANGVPRRRVAVRS